MIATEVPLVFVYQGGGYSTHTCTLDQVPGTISDFIPEPNCCSIVDYIYITLPRVCCYVDGVWDGVKTTYTVRNEVIPSEYIKEISIDT